MYEKNIISLHALRKHTTITPVISQTRHSLKNPLNETASSFFSVFDFKKKSPELLARAICKQVHIFGTNEGKSI